MKTLLFICIMFPYIVWSQLPDSCFTQQQIQDISFTLDSLYELNDINDSIIAEQYKLISEYSQLVKLDELQLEYKTQQIDFLKKNIELYVDREKYLTPKWYDNKSIWFGSGIVTTVLVMYLVR